MKIKVISVVGNRPQFIKLKPLAENFLNYKSQIIHKIIHTGQHYDYSMSKMFFEELNLPKSDYNLSVGGISHSKFTAQVLNKLEIILKKEKPSCILVYGDTDTTLAASICAVKMNIQIFHIEAGLRSYNKKMPEEINRVLTDHISDLYFVPTKNAKKNLIKENISIRRIKFVGDLMYELLSQTKNSDLFKKIDKYYYKKDKYCLITIHRAENTKNKNTITNFLNTLEKTSLNYLWPCHPRSKKFIKNKNIKIPKNIKLIQPLSYYNMLACINNAELILTDSGGVQKEAFFLKKPCIVLRDRTEWIEIVESKNSLILGDKKLKLLISKAIKMDIKSSKIFGSKNVSTKIINEIIKFYE